MTTVFFDRYRSTNLPPATERNGMGPFIALAQMVGSLLLEVENQVILYIIESSPFIDCGVLRGERRVRIRGTYLHSSELAGKGLGASLHAVRVFFGGEEMSRA